MTKEIPLSRGLVALVDDEDFDWLSQWKWCATGNGYAKRGASSILMHRVIVDAPKGLQVDHADGNRLNNSRQNLRVCTSSENLRNRPKLRSNSSGFIGVYFCRSNRAFQASVKVNGIPHYAGSFPTAEEAARARDAKALVLHGSFARLNFPIDGA